MAQITLNSSGVASNGSLLLQSNGTTTAVTVDASQNVGVGVTPAVKLDIGGVARTQNTADRDGVTIKRTNNANANGALNFTGSDDVVDAAIAMATDVADALTFRTAGSERARIDSSGNLLVGTTSVISAGKQSISFSGVSQVGCSLQTTTGDGIMMRYLNSSGTIAGSVFMNGTSTAYNTSSDYRLKHDIAPMNGALAKVAALKPCTYKWNADDSDGEGFIAHELAEVVPNCVTGEKDAVDAEGNPQYQGIDTSFLVATLTAAIQEQQAIITQLQADVAALKGTA